MKHILVGIDGTNESLAAARAAVGIARSTLATVDLVCVVPPFEALASESLSPIEIIEDQKAQAAGILRSLAQELEAPGLAIETMVVEGVPADRLASLAAERAVEMVVVGHRRRGPISRLLIGSVADRLVQISTRPVLVVH